MMLETLFGVFNNRRNNERNFVISKYMLTHWGRAKHICVSNLTIICSDNGLSPGRRQAIFWTNDGILLIRRLGTNFNEISIVILTFSFKKMRLKLSSAKWWPFCLGLNVLSFCLECTREGNIVWVNSPSSAPCFDKCKCFINGKRAPIQYKDVILPV